MGQVSYSKPTSFEDMVEPEVVVNVAAEAVAEVNNIEVAEEATAEVVSAETDRNDTPTV